MTLKEKLNELLANSKLGSAIDLLLDRVKNTEYDLHNTFIQFKARYTANENDNNSGIISRDEYTRTKNQILHGVQQFMLNIPEEILNLEVEVVKNANRDNQNQFLQKEIEGYQSQLKLKIEKLNFFKEERDLATGADHKFSLDKQIKQLENEINALKAKLNINDIVENSIKIPHSYGNKKGVLLFSIPPKMQIRVEHKCLIRIAFNESMLLQDLPKIINKYEIRENIRLSDDNNLELNFEPNENFIIKSITKNSIQRIEIDDFVEWHYHVIPLNVGKFHLTFNIIANIIAADGKFYREKVFSEPVEVVTYEVPEALSTGFKLVDVSIEQKDIFEMNNNSNHELNKLRNLYYSLGLTHYENRGKNVESFDAKIELDKVNDSLNDKKKQIVYFYTCPKGMPNPPSNMDYSAIRDGEKVDKGIEFKETIYFDKNDIPYHRFLDTINGIFAKDEPYKSIFILHLAMHGKKDTDGNFYLIFRDNEGNAFEVNLNYFTEWIHKLTQKYHIEIHCILISACHSFEFAKSITNYTECVIGMKTKVQIPEAPKFSEGFYSKIFIGESIHEAYKDGAIPNLGNRCDDDGNYPKEIPYLFYNPK